MRTTSSLEAYNGVLNNNLTAHGNFFIFVHSIRAEELLKRDEFNNYINSGGQTAKKRRPEYIVSMHILFFSLSIHYYISFFLFHTES